MYELINTSVPNGLIAGTHGFATVAMTKGMPDAIRQRVENFCAYPHRTSAHDASYFSENPVNWFHLMLPGGDHVVGRTAPAEFDYTGRTNRISHVLCFSAREMPLNGGAYVLTAESNRFCAGWSGDPKYLAVDKVTSGRLQLDARPSGYGPIHWIQMFGADGTAYAQKFAVLLAQNMRTSKGIYFKASKADNDGKRLLGLFADLINILPDEIAAQVTFSTFAACVPNGVACHLRGIYDKDHAFETASALQPWVDCENCCVKHPELLPDGEIAILPQIARQADAGIEKGPGRPHINVWNGEKGSALPLSYPRRPQSSGPCEKHTSLFLKIAAISVPLMLLGGIAVGVWYFQKSSHGSSEQIAVQICRQEISKWHASQTNVIASFRNNARGRNDSSAIVSIKNDVERLESLLESDYSRQMEYVYSEIIGDNVAKETIVKVCRRDKERAIEECRKKCKELIGDLDFRLDDLKKQQAHQAQKHQEKVEHDSLQNAKDELRRFKEGWEQLKRSNDIAELERLRTRINAARDHLNEKIDKVKYAEISSEYETLINDVSNRIITLKNMEERLREIQKLVMTPLCRLPNAGVKLLDKASWENDRQLGDKLTNEWCIAEWRFERGTLLCRKAYFKCIGKGRKLVYEPTSGEKEYSPWTVVHGVNSPSSEVVFWIRNEIPEVQFDVGGELDLKKICFGNDEAYGQWKRVFGPPIYQVAWKSSIERDEEAQNTDPGYFTTKDRLAIAHYSDKVSVLGKVDEKEMQKKKAKEKADAEKLEREINEIQTKIDSLPNHLDTLKKALKDYAELKKSKSEADKKDDKDKKKDCDSKMRNARKSNFETFKKYAKLKGWCQNGEVRLDTITDKDCEVAIQQEKAVLQQELQAKQGKKKPTEKDLKNGEIKRYRERKFIVKVITKNELPEKAVERYNVRTGTIDCALLWIGCGWKAK